MSGAWVAGVTRARALVRRRLGESGTRRLGRAETFEAAVEALAGTPYGHDVRPGQDRDAAAHAVAATLLWHLRVLAGWVPPGGADVMRLLARWFEIANVDAALAGRDARFRLGALATSWPRLEQAGTPQALRAGLASSAWGDPGDDSPARSCSAASSTACCARSTAPGRGWTPPAPVRATNGPGTSARCSPRGHPSSRARRSAP